MQLYRFIPSLRNNTKRAGQIGCCCGLPLHIPSTTVRGSTSTECNCKTPPVKRNPVWLRVGSAGRKQGRTGFECLRTSLTEGYQVEAYCSDFSVIAACSITDGKGLIAQCVKRMGTTHANRILGCRCGTTARVFFAVIGGWVVSWQCWTEEEKNVSSTWKPGWILCESDRRITRTLITDDWTILSFASIYYCLHDFVPRLQDIVWSTRNC